MAAAWAAPEENTHLQPMTVVVLDAHVQPAQPVQRVRVSLTYLADSKVITASQDVTNRSGQVLLHVSPDAGLSGDLRIEITGASDLVIYQPADGQMAGVPATLTISLVPKGSVLLLGPAQIEAMLRRLSLQSNAKSKEIGSLKGKLAEAQNQKPDLDAAMTEWASQNGFAAADANKKIQEWAEEVQQGKQQATNEQKALAELALKHYGAAAQLFGETVSDISQSMDEDEMRFLEERRSKLRDLVEKSMQSANAYQLDLKYHQATRIMEQARDRAAAEHGRYPEDAVLREIWLAALFDTAKERMEEGEVAPAADSTLQLSRSIEDFRKLLTEYAGQDHRKDRALLQNNLAIALQMLGTRSSGAQSTDLLDQAVAAYREALAALIRADTPQEWAMIEDNLGTALLSQGVRSTGPQSLGLLAQAVEAHRAALEVFTKSSSPANWSAAQDHLGIALWSEAERSNSLQATELLAQAVEAYRLALEVRTKAEVPREWAETQSNLGIVLWSKSEQSNTGQATELLIQAVAAFRAALEVDTQADLPQDWAMIQTNLGSALLDQGSSSEGAQAMGFFAQAEQAFRGALTVLTKTDLPQDWARSESDLGNSLVFQADRSSDARATELIAEAVAAYRSALTVRTKADLPQDWANTQNNLGRALTERAERSSDAQATELLAQATQAYRAALEVDTKADLPRNWERTENNLARVMGDQGDFTGALAVLEECLEAFPTDSDALINADSIYHDKLFRFDRAYELVQQLLKLDNSPGNQLDMVEAELTTSRFEECEKQAAAMDDALFPAPATSSIVIRDTMKLACQWGAGDKTGAQETGKALALKSSKFEKSGWGVAGTLHYLATSPAFTSGRTSWAALFQSLQEGDGAALAAALKQLEEVMKN